MNYFHVWNLKRLRRWIVISIVAFLTAFVLWINDNQVFPVFNEKETVAITKGNTNEPNIALTFNISWGEDRVHDVLEKLNKYDIHATFFVSGEWAERHPTILEAITDGKHEIGMLGYRYKSYLDQDLEQIRRDLFKADEVFKKLGYDNIQYLRPPSGKFDKDILNLAENMNYRVIHWNVNPHDWKNPGTELIVDTVMKTTENGDIILLHASDSVKQTAEALDTILPGLKNKGFHFVTITELLNQAHAESNIIE